MLQFMRHKRRGRRPSVCHAYEQALLRCLSDGAWWTCHELARATNLLPLHVTSALRALVAEGQVEKAPLISRVWQGKYRRSCAVPRLDWFERFAIGVLIILGFLLLAIVGTIVSLLMS